MLLQQEAKGNRDRRLKSLKTKFLSILGGFEIADTGLSMLEVFENVVAYNVCNTCMSAF